MKKENQTTLSSPQAKPRSGAARAGIRRIMRAAKPRSLIIFSAIALSACADMGDRLKNVGKPPQMSQIVNPATQPGYEPVSMPMPAPQQVTQERNSLWSTSRQTFFKDQRATDVGDIITVLIKINDQAKLDNKTDRTRSSSEKADVTKFLGGETKLGKVFSDAVDPSKLIDLGGDSSHSGDGKIDRKEDIEMKVAAVITQILPNGNMVIKGRQEVRVNFEKRILNVDGVIRPQDISIANTVSYDQIAEARIIYGGEGQLTDVQQPRYGQQVYDALFPF